MFSPFLKRKGERESMLLASHGVFNISGRIHKSQIIGAPPGEKRETGRSKLEKKKKQTFHYITLFVPFELHSMLLFQIH